MKKTNRITAIIAIISLMGLMTVAQAQRRDYRVNERDVKRLVSRIESGANRFRNSLDRALDRSRLDGSRQEDNINQFVKDFEQATNRLKEHANDDDRSAIGDAEEVLKRAKVIDGFMRRHRLASRAESDWRNLRRDLDSLARLYRVSARW